MKSFVALAALILAVYVVSSKCNQPDNHPPINSANSNSNRNVTTNNNDDSLSQVFGNQNAEDPNQFPCSDGQACARNKSLSTEGGESILAKSALETAEEGTEDVAAETISKVDVEKQLVDFIFTYRKTLDDKKNPNDVPKPVCGNVQKDVRGTCGNGLCKSGTEVVALLTQTSFSRNEKSRTLKSLGQARIDLQDTFDQFGKRWVCLYLQWNGVHPSPQAFGTVFIQADKTFPIDLIRKAFNESMQKCVKVWLEVAPKAVPNDPK